MTWDKFINLSVLQFPGNNNDICILEFAGYFLRLDFQTCFRGQHRLGTSCLNLMMSAIDITDQEGVRRCQKKGAVLNRGDRKAKFIQRPEEGTGMRHIDAGIREF